MINYVHARETEMVCHHGNGYHDLTLLFIMVSCSHPPTLPYCLPQPHIQDIYQVPAVSISVEPDH